METDVEDIETMSEDTVGDRIVKVILFILLALLLALCVLLVKNFRDFASVESLNAGSLPTAFLHRPHPLPVSAADTIQPWMTFDYINHTFNLPRAYLQGSLSITNPRYPYVTVAAYVKANKLNAGDFLDTVRNAVRSFEP